MDFTGKVKIVNGRAVSRRGEMIVRGDLHPETFGALMLDKYQREQLSAKKIAGIMEGLRGPHGVPEIHVGMRGIDLQEPEPGTFVLMDPSFIVDGQQRTAAATQVYLLDKIDPLLPVTVHLNTTYDIERKLFLALNLGHTKVSANVILVNLADDFEIISKLMALTMNRGFVLHERVCWKQNMTRGDLISAFTFMKVAAMLHSHKGPGRGSNVTDVTLGLDKIVSKVAMGTMVSNTRTFFETVDKAWTIKNIAYVKKSVFIKETFLLQLARIFSDHKTVWNSNHLVVDPHIIRRLSEFPLMDHTVQGLASGASSGDNGRQLYELMIEHLDSRRRANKRLQKWDPQSEESVALSTLHDEDELDEAA